MWVEPLTRAFGRCLLAKLWDEALTYSQIVTEDSAAPILDNTDRAGLWSDHRNMCKFSSRNAPGYALVTSSLVRYSRDAPAVISRRWALADQIKKSMRTHEASDLLEDV